MIDAANLRTLVIAPALDWISLGGDAAEELLLGTCLQESGGGRWLQQHPGPALGLWQMEPLTHDDIWRNFLAYRRDLEGLMRGLALTRTSAQPMPESAQLATNLLYACAMARIQYFRSPAPLPLAGDLPAQARYWDTEYNRNPAKGSPVQYVASWTALLKV